MSTTTRTRLRSCDKRLPRSFRRSRSVAASSDSPCEVEVAHTVRLPPFVSGTVEDYVTRCGGSVSNVCLREDRESGRISLCAARALRRGEEVASVPRQAWLTPSSSGWEAATSLPAFSSLRPWVRLALRLIHEVSKGEQSVYSAYLSTLPDTPRAVVGWPQATAARLLRGSQLYEVYDEYQDFLVQQWEVVTEECIGPSATSSSSSVFPPEIFTYESFLWAFAILRARTFSPLQGEDIALVPLLDCCTHSVGGEGWRKSERGFLEKEESVKLNAWNAVVPGDAIAMRYDSVTSSLTVSQLLLDYGVYEDTLVSSSSSLRPSYSITLSFPPSDPNLEDKLAIIEDAGFPDSPSFLLSGAVGSAPPEEMVAFLRLLHLGGQDAFLLESIFRDKVWDFLLLPVSKENEMAVCQSIIQGTKEALQGYRSGEEESEGGLSVEDGGVKQEREWRQRVSALAVSAEKRALLCTLEWFESRMAQVDALEYYQERRLRKLKLIDDSGNSTYDPFDDLTIA